MPQMPKIHPTAIVHPGAELADDVEVGPYCIVAADVRVGAGTRLAEHVILRQYTIMGRDNLVDAFCVMGGCPQDLDFDPKTESFLRIGNGNVFREGVTISRATKPGGATTVGDGTYWMATAHAAHDTVVADQAILVNGSALGGHAKLGRGAILSGNAMVHQFCWVADMVMVRGMSRVNMHAPPYTMLAETSRVVGLNAVGLRRAESLCDEDRRQIKEAFRLTYRSGLTPAAALEKMDACDDWGQAAAKFRDFVRQVLSADKPYKRGLCPLRSRRRDGAR